MAAPEERRWIDSNKKKEQQRLSQQLRVRRQPAGNDDDIRRGAATCAHAYLGVAHVARQSDHFLRVLLRDAAFVRVICTMDGVRSGVCVVCGMRDGSFSDFGSSICAIHVLAIRVFRLPFGPPQRGQAAKAV